MATFVPAALLTLGAFTVPPVVYYPRYIINNTGDWGLRFLVLTLAVTPLRRLTGWHNVIRLRRTLGLAAFFYSAAHLLAWAILSWNLELRSMLQRMISDLFFAIGTAAFVLLVPLAWTSNRASMSRLGRRWRKLHWLVYPAAIATLWHVWLKDSFAASDVRKWIAIVVVLFGFRLVTAWRQRRHVT